MLTNVVRTAADAETKLMARADERVKKDGDVFADTQGPAWEKSPHLTPVGAS
jgi:hypothetical protein